MVEVRQTEEFTRWLHHLKNNEAASRIIARLRRMELGNPGDAKGIGRGVMEMRIDYGAGYRVYYVRRGERLVILLCGGDKRTQRKDIELAHRLAEEV
jgi:putative addiction module killer protein